MTSCTVDVEGSTTPHNLSQSTMKKKSSHPKTQYLDLVAKTNKRV